jgi:serine/threonine protein kinase
LAYQSLVRVNKRYELVDLIGSGTMGSVYQAVDHLTGQTVALKQLPDAAPDQESDFRLALAREFTILASLRHPHIISVQDYDFDEQQQPFFTMEYLSPRAKSFGLRAG